MNADETDRMRLRELLLDDVELPSETEREAMFERTFTSPPGAGQDLLPPDGTFDASPDDVEDGARATDGGTGGGDGHSATDDDADAPDRPGPTHPDPDPDPTDPATADHDGGPGEEGVLPPGDPFPDW